MASLIPRCGVLTQISAPLRQPATLLARQPLKHPLRNTSVRQLPRSRFSINQAQSSKSQQCYYSTVVVHDTTKSRGGRSIGFWILAVGAFALGAHQAFLYAPPFLSPLIMGSVPTDVETLKYEAPDELTREIDEHIKNCKIARSLRANPDFIESRPHEKLPYEVRQHNLTAGTLSGNTMIAVPPLIFNEKGGKSMVCIFYAGPDLCGHPGMIHGGFLATMLDEGLARCAFPAMPNHVGVTANLTVNYRQPTMAGQYLVLKATTTKVEGRKAWAEGWIEPLETTDGEPPSKLVEASALFIEPRHAAVMKSLYRIAT